jgi:hypothetical protein
MNKAVSVFRESEADVDVGKRYTRLVFEILLEDLSSLFRSYFKF